MLAPKSSDSKLESANSNANSSADPAKISLWVWAFSFLLTLLYFLVYQSIIVPEAPVSIPTIVDLILTLILLSL